MNSCFQRPVLIALFASLTALGSYIQIPNPLVPITLQTFFVYLSGAVLGSCGGFMSQLLFLVLGLIGIPVFASGGGPGYILQPTFGYLAGFPVAAAVIGILLSKLRFNEKTNYIIALLSAIAVILVLGTFYLYINMTLIMKKSMGLKELLLSGLIIFLPGEIVKAALSMQIARRLRSQMQGIP